MASLLLCLHQAGFPPGGLQCLGLGFLLCLADLQIGQLRCPLLLEGCLVLLLPPLSLRNDRLPVELQLIAGRRPRR